MELDTLAQLLHETQCSCVVHNGQTRTFTRRGVIDIYELLYNDREFLCGASVADRVIGKGAAALMALGGVKEVYADVISSSALSLLEEHGVAVKCKEVAGFIWNRDHSDSCPLEKLCLQENDLTNMLAIIDKFIQSKAS